MAGKEWGKSCPVSIGEGDYILSVLRGAIFGIVLLAAADCLALSDEEYLQYIEAEAAGLSEPSRPAIPNAAVTGKSAGKLAQPEFEALLKAKYRGTYSIYESLLDNDKAEVYKTYFSGASMRKVRRMIIDRKMHR